MLSTVLIDGVELYLSPALLENGDSYLSLFCVLGRSLLQRTTLLYKTEIRLPDAPLVYL